MPRDEQVSPLLRYRESGSRGLVLTCEHAAAELPTDAPPSRAESRVLRDHWGWDPGAWDTSCALADALDAPVLGGRWSRLWLDLNRHVADPTLVRHEVEGVRLTFNDDVDDDELHRRIDAIHVPYHEAVDREIRKHVIDGRLPALVAVHSFTPNYMGAVRDFDVGVLYHRHDAPAQRLVRALKRTGLSVRANQPYSGKRGMMYSAERHGSHHGCVCLELELNQGLFRRGGGSRHVKDVLCELLDRHVDDWSTPARISGGSADAPGRPAAPRPSSRSRARTAS